MHLKYNGPTFLSSRCHRKGDARIPPPLVVSQVRDARLLTTSSLCGIMNHAIQRITTHELPSASHLRASYSNFFTLDFHHSAPTIELHMHHD